jgi:hypothetical protein
VSHEPGYRRYLVKCESAGRHAGRLARRRPEVRARVLAFLTEVLEAPAPDPERATAPTPPERAVMTR